MDRGSFILRWETIFLYNAYRVPRNGLSSRDIKLSKTFPCPQNGCGLRKYSGHPHSEFLINSVWLRFPPNLLKITDFSEESDMEKSNQIIKWKEVPHRHRRQYSAYQRERELGEGRKYMVTERDLTLGGHSSSLAGWKKFWGWGMVSVAQRCTYTLMPPTCTLKNGCRGKVYVYFVTIKMN